LLFLKPAQYHTSPPTWSPLCLSTWIYYLDISRPIPLRKNQPLFLLILNQLAAQPKQHQSYTHRSWHATSLTKPIR
jgi:hypothetical protein